MEDADIEADVRTALDAGASPNARDKYGETLLLQAVENERVGTVRVLLRRGANPNLAVLNDKWGSSPGETPLMRVLSKDFAPPQLSADRLQMLRMLLQRGANPNQRDQAGDTALHLAARDGWPEAVTLFLKYGADFQLRDPYRQTALQLASFPVARGSMMGAGFSNAPLPRDPREAKHVMDEEFKRDEAMNRAREKHWAIGRAAVVKVLRAAGAKK